MSATAETLALHRADKRLPENRSVRCPKCGSLSYYPLGSGRGFHPVEVSRCACGFIGMRYKSEAEIRDAVRRFCWIAGH